MSSLVHLSCRIRVEEEKVAAEVALKEMKELELAERIANGDDEEDASMLYVYIHIEMLQFHIFI